MVRGSTIDVSKVAYDIDLAIHNKFDVEVIDATTGKIKQKAEAYNIIKDCFWEYFFSNAYCSEWFGGIVFGSGSGTPSADKLGLFSFVGGKQAASRNIQTFPKEGYAYNRRSISLGVSEFVGSTITEVGTSVYGTDQANRIFTHAMLQDMNGNPISITKTDTDIINIYATIYVHWNPDGYEDGKIKISYLPGEMWDKGIINELLGCMTKDSPASGRSIYFFNGPPVSKSFSIGSVSTSSIKDLATKTIRLAPGRLGVGSGNGTGGILSAYTSGICIEGPSAGLPGTNIIAEPVGTGDGTTTDFVTQYPFPTNTEIYVDGVLCTDVVIDDVLPSSRFVPTMAFKFLQKYSEGLCGVPLNQYNGTTGSGVSSSGFGIYENVYADYGVKTIRFAHGNNWVATIALSNDLETWREFPCTLYDKTLEIPEELAYARYWKISGGTPSGASHGSARPLITPITPFPTHNIRFTTPPAEGAVITANYYTPAVAKDENHVFDMSITIHLGEYTE